MMSFYYIPQSMWSLMTKRCSFFPHKKKRFLTKKVSSSCYDSVKNVEIFTSTTKKCTKKIIVDGTEMNILFFFSSVRLLFFAFTFNKRYTTWNLDFFFLSSQVSISFVCSTELPLTVLLSSSSSSSYFTLLYHFEAPIIYYALMWRPQKNFSSLLDVAHIQCIFDARHLGDRLTSLRASCILHVGIKFF